MRSLPSIMFLYLLLMHIKTQVIIITDFSQSSYLGKWFKASGWSILHGRMKWLQREIQKQRVPLHAKLFTSTDKLFHLHVWIFNLPFPFFLLQDTQYRQLLLRLPESRRGKVSMWPQRPLLAGQSRYRPNCFRLSTSAVRALPPPPSLSPFLYCDTNSHFPLPQTWTFIPIPSLTLSLSLSHTHKVMS